MSCDIKISLKEGLSLKLFIQQQNQPDWLEFQKLQLEAPYNSQYSHLELVALIAWAALFHVPLHRHRVSNIDLYNRLSYKQKKSELSLCKISEILHYLLG